MPRHTGRGLVLHDGKLLLMERWRPGKHYFSIPGGGIEVGENPVQAAERELLEETGCTVTADSLQYTFETPDGSLHSIYLCTYVTGEPHLPADSPEASADDPDNRFNPRWVDLTELGSLPFLVWQPVMDRFVEDLAAGTFPHKPVRLAPDA